MKKLRLVKERAVSSEIENDLRGLGSDPLLQESSPAVYLTISGLNESAPLVPFLRKYGLAVDVSAHAQILHVRLAQLQEGKHKEQAVILFVAALDLLERCPMVHLKLWQQNRLAHHLGRAIGQKSLERAHSLDGAVHTWRAHLAAPLTLEGVVTHYLDQAGFDIPSQIEQDLSLSHEEAQRLVSQLRSSASHSSSSLRKVG
jgi:hypothetical protein